MTDCIGMPCREVSHHSAPYTGGECETNSSLVQNHTASEAQPLGGILASQSQPDSQTTSLPVSSEDRSSTDVLKPMDMYFAQSGSNCLPS